MLHENTMAKPICFALLSGLLNSTKEAAVPEMRELGYTFESWFVLSSHGTTLGRIVRSFARSAPQALQRNGNRPFLKVHQKVGITLRFPMCSVKGEENIRLNRCAGGTIVAKGFLSGTNTPRILPWNGSQVDHAGVYTINEVG